MQRHVGSHEQRHEFTGRQRELARDAAANRHGIAPSSGGKRGPPADRGERRHILGGLHAKRHDGARDEVVLENSHGTRRVQRDGHQVGRHLRKGNHRRGVDEEHPELTAVGDFARRGVREGTGRRLRDHAVQRRYGDRRWRWSRLDRECRGRGHGEDVAILVHLRRRCERDHDPLDRRACDRTRRARCQCDCTIRELSLRCGSVWQQQRNQRHRKREMPRQRGEFLLVWANSGR
mmetsp:Transcript_9006/g.23502  ORF Transcript_9006/g.23502 Transcript_9006/m.23502 type:complete len:234 (+) Transcript_9006:914-1615(+)